MRPSRWPRAIHRRLSGLSSAGRRVATVAKPSPIPAGHQIHVLPFRHAQTVTTLEEEKIMAYFGAGLLYADERRAEPLL